MGKLDIERLNLTLSESQTHAELLQRNLSQQLVESKRLNSDLSTCNQDLTAVREDLQVKDIFFSDCSYEAQSLREKLEELEGAKPGLDNGTNSADVAVDSPEESHASVDEEASTTVAPSLAPEPVEGCWRHCFLGICIEAEQCTQRA